MLFFVSLHQTNYKFYQQKIDQNNKQLSLMIYIAYLTTNAQS